jgi:hypothetical protein
VEVNRLFAKGMAVDFCSVAVLIVLVMWVYQRAKAGQRVPDIRKIAGLDAISEAVGRATEMDRPVLYLTGSGSFNEPQLLASMAILAEVAKLAARYQARLLVPVPMSYVHPVAQDIVRTAYASEGKLDSFKADDVRWISDHYFGYAAGVVGLMFSERIAANIMIGSFAFDALMYAEAGHQAGAIQVAGTASTAQIAFLVAACDYALIGEEMYAAAAYLTKDPLRISSVVVEDWAKFVLTGLVILGVIAKTMGNVKWLTDLLSM